MNDDFDVLFNERFDYTPQPPPEAKAKMKEFWEKGIRLGIQLGDTRGEEDQGSLQNLDR